ncbi:MAG: ATP synthase F1 subunit gamma [Rickettsiaceae bacterium H1]|nr:ATP synthase F1 subunit gamma [Rickettsiaceae bacterium H1]
MSNLKELKIRINSVKSTKKITKVMKMVAAAKLKKAQKKAFDAKSCSIESENLINKTISTIPEHELPKLITGSKSTNFHLLFVITSDKGLCGGYNSNIIKIVKEYSKKITKKGIKPKLICIGKKGKESLKWELGDHIIKSVEKTSIDYKSAHELIDKIITEDKFDFAQIFYTKFESGMSQTPTEKQIIPFEKTKISPYECEYEPNKKAVLETLVKNNLAIQLYKAIVESHASEYVARMMAMDNATRNAEDMINKLALHYNRSRQAAITTELIEIISGAEAI